jgi:hypothetical protein
MRVTAPFARAGRPAARLHARLRRGADREPARRFADRTIEQIWEWEDDERYILRHRIVRDGEVAERRTRYRALRRATLTAALRAAGFTDVEWPATGFPQPVVTARTSSRATATSRTRR